MSYLPLCEPQLVLGNGQTAGCHNCRQVSRHRVSPANHQAITEVLCLGTVLDLTRPMKSGNPIRKALTILP